ncbi:MAG: winged helix-turn-helix domain-containing protein [Vicinamibacterales bacterium]
MLLAFGPFRLDRRTYTVTRAGTALPLSPKLVQVLACLVEARGELVTRELLLDRFWPALHVTDNTLTRAIADIRKALGDDAAAATYIQTMARRGYRFVAPVAEEAAPMDGPPGVVAPSKAVAGLEPFVAWERGRAALESLSIAALPGAIDAFSRAVAGAPHYAPGYAGLANAHVFRYEASRVDDVPVTAALTAAIAAAGRATELDPTLGEGWAALGHALAGSGRGDQARAALRQAVALEPRNWRHHYRMAVCSWGEERLRAVERAEALLPGFPGAQTLAAMVLVARQSFAFARAAAERGAAAQAAQHDRTLYPAGGLLWLRGLIRFVGGDGEGARDDFAAEAATAAAATTVYARECRVLAHEALGFAALAAGDLTTAATAFAAADTHSPGHGRATLGAAVVAGAAAAAVERVSGACAAMDAAGKHGERAMLLAAAHGWSGRGADGLVVADQALVAAAADATGWSLPADPIFAPLRREAGWPRLAARLAARAS